MKLIIDDVIYNCVVDIDLHDCIVSLMLSDKHLYRNFVENKKFFIKDLVYLNDNKNIYGILKNCILREYKIGPVFLEMWLGYSDIVEDPSYSSAFRKIKLNKVA